MTKERHRVCQHVLCLCARVCDCCFHLVQLLFDVLLCCHHVNKSALTESVRPLKLFYMMQHGSDVLVTITHAGMREATLHSLIYKQRTQLLS